MRPLTILERRVAAIVLLIASLAAVVTAIVIPVRIAHDHFDMVITDSSDRIARYRRIAAGRGNLEKAIAAVKAKDAGRFYLKSSAPALAAADIQQIVQTLVEANGLQSESIGILPHKDEAGRRKITVNLRLRGKLAGMQHFFYAVESTQPYLLIDNLVLLGTVRQNYVPQPGTEHDVTATFELSGYALKRVNDVPVRR